MEQRVNSLIMSLSRKFIFRLSLVSTMTFFSCAIEEPTRKCLWQSQIISCKEHKKIEKKSVDATNIQDTGYTIEDSDADINKLKVSKLKEALELITPEEKMILLLKYQDGLSIKELTGILSVGESAVKMRIKRAKEKLINVYYENER